MGLKLTLPATINKSDIEPLADLRGRTNSASVTLSDHTYGIGEVVFRGFAGTYDKAISKWVGVYRFETASGNETETMDVAALPDRSGESEPKTTKATWPTTKAVSEVSNDGI